MGGGCCFDIIKQCNPTVDQRGSILNQWHADSNATLVIRGWAVGHQTTLYGAKLQAAESPEVDFSD